MRKVLTVAMLAITIWVFTVAMLMVSDRLSQISPVAWRNLNLPVHTGVFLQALALVCILYALWLAVGVFFQFASLWASGTGRTRLAQCLHRCSPRVLRGLAVSLLNAGLAVGPPMASALAAAEPQPNQIEEPTTETTTNPGPESTALVPVPTWVPHNTAITLTRSVGSPAPRENSRQVVQEVVVHSGDTLWDIARKRLGPTASISEVATYWPRIHVANHEAIGADPHLLRIGTVLFLPTT